MAKFILSSFADEASSNLNEQFRISGANDIRYIEMRGISGKNLVDYSMQEVKEIRNALDNNGFKLSALGSPFGKMHINDNFSSHLEHFKRAVEYAHILDAENIRMFSFFIPTNEDYSIYRDEVMERLNKFVEASGDVWCCHENEKGIYGDNDDRCLDILTTFEGKIRGIFDPANFIQCGVNPVTAMNKLQKYIDYMHIKDAYMESGSVVPAGCGDANMRQLLEMLENKQGSMFLSVEPHLTVFKGLESLGDDVSVRDCYSYQSQEEAYNAAINAIKDVLMSLNYKQEGAILWTR